MTNSYHNTFIIPTIGRGTLKRSIDSALQLDNTSVVVVFDGVPINKVVDDPRVVYIEVEKSRKNAGHSRNYGIDYIFNNIDTEWISFLDDDDYLINDFNKSIAGHSNYDLLIHSIEFPFHPKSRRILPAKRGTGIERGHMGIAMSVKKAVLEKYNICFRENRGKDYSFARDLINAGASHYKTGMVVYLATMKGNTEKK